MIFSPFERLVAFRYLRARRSEGFISVIASFSLLGIALGVATLIIVMSVMNGFRAELLSRVLGLNGHVSVFAATGPLPDYGRVAQAIQEIPGVRQAAPTIEGQAMATVTGVATGALVRGVRAEDLKNRPIIANHIVAGGIDAFAKDADGVLIGSRMARRLGLGIGDRITLVAPEGNPSPFGVMPRLKGFRVDGVFEVGMYEYDNTFVFMPLETAQKFFRVNDGVSMVEVFLSDPDRAATLESEIRQRLGTGYRLYDWRRSNASFVNALDVERNVMFLILTLIIVVAAFNIISSMIMLVKDKGRDIAILRAMGATRGMVMRIFFLCGTSVGFAGTAVGFGLGLAFTDNIETIRQWLQTLTGTPLFQPEIYFLSQLPAVIDPWEVTTVVLMALGLSVLATLYPSWRAGRLDPAEALRYE